MGAMSRKSTLQELLNSALEENGETPADIFAVAVGGEGVTYEDLDDYEGNIGYGGASLPNMQAWTSDYVYFKHVYDGAESVRYVPRNMTDKAVRVP